MTSPSPQEKVEGPMTLRDGDWAVYQRGGPANDGPWEFAEVLTAPDDPGSAARLWCANHWTDGSHDCLVVGPKEAVEFTIGVETTVKDPHS